MVAGPTLEKRSIRYENVDSVGSYFGWELCSLRG